MVEAHDVFQGDVIQENPRLAGRTAAQTDVGTLLGIRGGGQGIDGAQGIGFGVGIEVNIERGKLLGDKLGGNNSAGGHGDFARRATVFAQSDGHIRSGGNRLVFVTDVRNNETVAACTVESEISVQITLRTARRVVLQHDIRSDKRLIAAKISDCTGDLSGEGKGEEQGKEEEIFHCDVFF